MRSANPPQPQSAAPRRPPVRLSRLAVRRGTCIGCVAMRVARELMWRYAYIGALTFNLGGLNISYACYTALLPDLVAAAHDHLELARRHLDAFRARDLGARQQRQALLAEGGDLHAE